MSKSMKRFAARLAAGCLVLAAALPATAADLKVEVHGDHGRPVILVPGLGGGAWVWKDTAAALRGGHTVYVVTLPGFDGTPPPAGGNYLDQAGDALVGLIRERHLDKPVLVGHSLGGTLALKLASEHPELLGGVVAVDGLPVFPGSEGLPAAQRSAMAAAMQARMRAATPAQFQAQQIAYMQKIGVLDPAKAEVYGKLNAKSDPKATAQYMAEDFGLDLRAALKRADLPVLEISPYNAPDFAAGPMAMSEQQKADYYRSLLASAPKARVASIGPARHFVMLDQPAKFQQTLDAFLDTL
ncbi:alpha/beta hydrolase [Fulvimonas soli]|jgi:pimeloyl-ACP methyl ester carboxylesterase|uniref:Pimeloyl-ACP methyl ester carboxylesterase n=2 Tax=Fulvimonas soli TaxID=155197 RepID=A0A316HZI2_9GAMM|nr:pimeloyl-ACP methyl ester carboxylesterase [Fulvimonas soli]TNY27069.1 alpha/beta hydrolase [Fulvimonas soli]